MNTKLTLKGNLEAVLADIKNIYPDYPQGYEKFGKTIHERFIVTPPKQLVITPAEFDSEGNVTQEAVMGDWESKLVLPSGYDTSHLKTIA